MGYLLNEALSKNPSKQSSRAYLLLMFDSHRIKIEIGKKGNFDKISKFWCNMNKFQIKVHTA